MQWKTTVGVGYANQQGEKAFMSGFNGTGAAILPGSPVCWDTVASDGVTLAVPSVGVNFPMLAGIQENDTVGTAEYTHQIVAYGQVTMRTWGVASTFIPGALLILTDGDDYGSYGTAGQWNGTLAGQQPLAITALSTNTSVATTDQPVFIKALG